LGAIALGIATKSDEIMQTAGQLAQVYTLSYSRKQENESDDYGVRYLQANGYNLYAASDMLAALAAQEALDAKVKNRQSRDVPTWARSHPITTERVTRTANAARAAKASRDVPPEQVRPYLTALSGLRVGDDPEQGFVDGRRFSHPSMKITFEVPQGFALNNTSEAVEIEGPNSLKGRFGGGVPLTGALDAYAIAKVRETLGQTPANLGPATPGTTNGMPTITLLARAQTRSGLVDVGVIAYNLNGRAFHFVMIGPADGLSPTFPITQTFRELSATEIAALRPRELEIVTVLAGDTVASLSSRMAYPDFKTERFLMINGMRAERPLKPGELLKIVRFSGAGR
jgi:predicted Zn-dependent protease